MQNITIEKEKISTLYNEWITNNEKYKNIIKITLHYDSFLIIYFPKDVISIITKYLVTEHNMSLYFYNGTYKTICHFLLDELSLVFNIIFWSKDSKISLCSPNPLKFVNEIINIQEPNDKYSTINLYKTSFKYNDYLNFFCLFDDNFINQYYLHKHQYTYNNDSYVFCNYYTLDSNKQPIVNEKEGYKLILTRTIINMDEMKYVMNILKIIINTILDIIQQN